MFLWALLAAIIVVLTFSGAAPGDAGTGVVIAVLLAFAALCRYHMRHAEVRHHEYRA